MFYRSGWLRCVSFKYRYLRFGVRAGVLGVSLLYIIFYYYLILYSSLLLFFCSFLSHLPLFLPLSSSFLPILISLVFPPNPLPLFPTSSSHSSLLSSFLSSSLSSDLSHLSPILILPLIYSLPIPLIYLLFYSSFLLPSLTSSHSFYTCRCLLLDTYISDSSPNQQF